MKNKPKVNDTVSYPISGNGVGTGTVLDPELVGIPKPDRIYYKNANYVLVQAIVDGKPSYWFWIRISALIEPPKDKNEKAIRTI